MDRFKESLDRYITGNYGEDQFEDEKSIVLERGFKPVKQGTKCSYNNCPNEAVCYYFDSSKGLNLCENHGGKKIKSEWKYVCDDCSYKIALRRISR